MNTNQAVEKIVRKLTGKAETARTQLDKFVEEIKSDDPARAFAWSRSQFKYAAELSLATEWLTFFKQEFNEIDPVEMYKESLQSFIVGKAAGASNKSTSVTSNYMDDCLLQVAAEFLRDCRYL